MTARQREIFDFIVSFIAEVGYPPSIYDIGGHFGFSIKAAFDHVDVLVKEGYIAREDGKPRTLRPTRFACLFSFTAPLGLKHLGIQAGDVLTVSPADVPVEGDSVLTAQGAITKFEDGQEIVGKVVGMSRSLEVVR